jgi:hypothetical protein
MSLLLLSSNDWSGRQISHNRLISLNIGVSGPSTMTLLPQSVTTDFQWTRVRPNRRRAYHSQPTHSDGSRWPWPIHSIPQFIPCMWDESIQNQPKGGDTQPIPSAIHFKLIAPNIYPTNPDRTHSNPLPVEPIVRNPPRLWNTPDQAIHQLLGVSL